MTASSFTYKKLYKAYLDCRETKRNKPDAIAFEMDAAENLHRLCTELCERTYRPSTSICFAAKKPKLREIFAAHFRDRIIHHLLVRHLEKIWEPVFIYDSYASRPGKGIHLAAKRLRKFLNKITENGVRPAFFVQLDIKNFFMSINKHILFDLVAARCKNPDMLWLAQVVIFHDPTCNYRMKSPVSLMKQIPSQKSLFGTGKNKGLPIGNLTSQFLANVYLNGLDQFVKHRLKCRFYMRYVDDLVLVSEHREDCIKWHAHIERYLADVLKLRLKSDRKLAPVRNGIDFLGYVVRPDYTLCRNRVVNNLKSKLWDYRRRLVEEKPGLRIVRFDGDVLNSLFSSLNSYLGHFRHAQTHHLIQSLLQKNPWLGYYFFIRDGKLKRRYLLPKNFVTLKSQYLCLSRKFWPTLLFFQVGCFYEFYGVQAAKASQVLKLKMIKGKYDFKTRCGFGAKALKRYAFSAIKQGCAVSVAQQTGYVSGNVMQRQLNKQLFPVRRSGR